MTGVRVEASLNHIMKGIYSEEYIADLTFKNHPLFSLFSKHPGS